MVDSIAKTLGSGSGIDVGALVTSLVDAQFAPKTAQHTRREETLKAQVSAVATLKNGLTGFASALASIAGSGTLATAPTSSDTGSVRVTTLPGARLTKLSAAIDVRALAAAQTAVTREPTAPGAPTGTGSIQIRFGTYADDGSFAPAAGTPPAPIVIGAGDATLAGIAARINASMSGVSASVVNDGRGERLVMRGATGAERGFTLTATDGDTPGLAAAVDVGPGAAGTRIATPAADAVIAVDGLEVRRPSNTVTDLVPGVRLDLAGVSTRPVAIGTTPPAAALTTTINDFVATFNALHAELKTATDPVTGALARDAGAAGLARAFRSLTLTDLTGATDGSPRTLADIGVATNRDGTIRLDAKRLASVLESHPAAVEAMFAAPTGAVGERGLPAALNGISSATTARTTGLGASEVRYGAAQTALAKERAGVADGRTRMTARLTQTYAGMDARVAAYKATQSFITAQVDAWNRKD